MLNPFVQWPSLARCRPIFCRDYKLPKPQNHLASKKDLHDKTILGTLYSYLKRYLLVYLKLGHSIIGGKWMVLLEKWLLSVISKFSSVVASHPKEEPLHLRPQGNLTYKSRTFFRDAVQVSPWLTLSLVGINSVGTCFRRSTFSGAFDGGQRRDMICNSW